MKRVLKYLGIALAVIFIVVGGAFWLMFGRQPSAPELQEVNQIHFVSDGLATVGIVPTAPNEAVLIDAGNDPGGAALLAELSRMQMTADSVTAIFFTHGHGDHIGGAGLFPKAQLLSLAPDVDLVAGLKKPRGPVVRLFPVKPTGLKVTRVLQDGETITFGQIVVKVFATPGHTGGSASYLVNGVLFVGDSADATAAGTLQSAHWVFSDDMSQNEASLKKLELTLRESGEVVQAIAFAHSGILQEGLAPLSAWVREQAP